MSEFDPPPVAPTGWYPDPHRPGQSRYWDGTRWTGTSEGAGPGEPVPTRRPSTSAKSIWALSLAIGSWLVCPILAAVAALILARASSRDITASNSPTNGRSLNTAARIVAWTNIGWWAFFCASILVWAWGQTPSVTATGSLARGSYSEALVDPGLNERIGLLPNGRYIMRPEGQILATSKIGGDVRYCLFQGPVYREGSQDANLGFREATIYGDDERACRGGGPYVGAVYFTVTAGVAHDLRAFPGAPQQ